MFTKRNEILTNNPNVSGAQLATLPLLSLQRCVEWVLKALMVYRLNLLSIILYKMVTSQLRYPLGNLLSAQMRLITDLNQLIWTEKCFSPGSFQAQPLNTGAFAHVDLAAVNPIVYVMSGSRKVSDLLNLR